MVNSEFRSEGKGWQLAIIILAWEAAEPNAWLNADFLNAWESQSQRLSLIGSRAAEVTLSLIPP
jgi:hypothetical protein